MKQLYQTVLRPLVGVLSAALAVEFFITSSATSRGQFYLQPLRVLLHPLSIQQSKGQKDLTQVGAKDRQKARVFRASPFLSFSKELRS
ncbi:hypothetical protein V6N12_068121 [Hibiscus sabdariffa]|uniref:Secreted protein n=1 Tax=Hibiscus sabdariffa TaxID=183260 RepID=A0ABR2FP12_9ROSI